MSTFLVPCIYGIWVQLEVDLKIVHLRLDGKGSKSRQFDEVKGPFLSNKLVKNLGKNTRTVTKIVKNR